MPITHERTEFLLPVIALFYGIIIMMYAGDNEHNPPHFHAKYNEYRAAYDFEGNIIEGNMPPRQHRMISGWAAAHEDDLIADWELCKAGLQPWKITDRI